MTRMTERISVDAVVAEKTHVGKVRFPVAVPQSLVELIRFPDDVYEHAEALGLDETAVKFLLAALNGKWGLSAAADLQSLAIKTGMQYSQMDEIVRGLLAKNYARLTDRLDLYRFWIALLHVKDVRFVAE
jgi:hypothetical protein